MTFKKDELNTEKDYEIRLFEWCDIEKYLNQIIDFQLENIYKFHYPKKTPDRNYVKKKILQIEKHLQDGNTYFIGIIKEEKLYGFLWSYANMFLDEKRMHINSLYVCKEARKKSFGKKLMNEIKRISLEKGCHSIGTHYASFNELAGSFYSKNGFIPTRVEAVHTLDNDTKQDIRHFYRI